MREQRLQELLRQVEVPGAAAAERRGMLVVEEAFGRRPPAARPPLPRLAVTVAIAVLLTVLLLSPAGAAVRDWIGDVFSAGVPNAEPELSGLPGGGRLLVQSSQGPWVVRPDGSRRLLGDYSEASWSPHGLFVAATSGRSLTAIEPDGTPHWTISAAGTVREPRWSPSGFEIAYRAGSALHVVAGDGAGDERIDRSVAAVPPSFSSRGLAQLAYVRADDRLKIVDTAGGVRLAAAQAVAGIEALHWGRHDSLLLEVAPRVLRLRSVTARKSVASLRIGSPTRLPVAAGAIVRDAVLSPDGATVAALLADEAGGRGRRSEVVLYPTGGGAPRRLFSAPGRLSGLAWSPGGDRLLIAWPEADQWLFVPTGESGRVHAVDGISRAFAPGGSAGGAFPRIEGWCCAAVPGP
jgi:dipeptidyl aminopeptidase/acylaminoacyl peptidase